MGWLDPHIQSIHILLFPDTHSEGQTLMDFLGKSTDSECLVKTIVLISLYLKAVR